MTTGDAAAGAEVFASTAVGTATRWRPPIARDCRADLDELQPDFETVVRQITNRGGMPAFEGQLSEKQLQDVCSLRLQERRGLTAATRGAPNSRSILATRGVGQTLS